jgi:hypothetical protein
MVEVVVENVAEAGYLRIISGETTINTSNQFLML